MPHVYVTGHKNPDTDTIASAIAYAEYKNLVDPENHYSPARLGEVNAQTGWALEKSGAESPKLIRHIMLRVKDVMKKELVTAHRNDPLRNVGLAMAKRNIGQIPLVDDDGALVGIITERDRSEEHTSELQSRQYLVCRLLLEKKTTQYSASLYVATTETQIAHILSRVP